MDTDASLQLFLLLKNLNDNLTIKNIIVFWYHEEEDMEHIETGKVLSEKLKRIKFFYKSYVR